MKSRMPLKIRVPCCFIKLQITQSQKFPMESHFSRIIQTVTGLLVPPVDFVSRISFPIHYSLGNSAFELFLFCGEGKTRIPLPALWLTVEFRMLAFVLGFVTLIPLKAEYSTRRKDMKGGTPIVSIAEVTLYPFPTPA